MSRNQKRPASESEDENQQEKKQQTETASLVTPAELAKAINIELSKSVTFKRSRSKSNDPVERNVRARMTVDLSCSNPEPTTFLMGTIANELENISRMLSPVVPNSGAEASPSSSASHSSPSSHSSNSSHSSPSSTASSPDYYDRLVERGYELMDRMRQDPSFAKYL